MNCWHQSYFCEPVEKWGFSGKRIVPRESEEVNLFRRDNMDFGNVVVLSHRSRSRSISIHGGKYLSARREDSDASYKLCSGRTSMYLHEVVNGCIGSSLFYYVMMDPVCACSWEKEFVHFRVETHRNFWMQKYIKVALIFQNSKYYFR